MLKTKIKVNRQLFNETSHTPALTDLVDERSRKKVTDFCFIENPYFPGKRYLKKLNRKFTELIKNYPSSNPKLAQQDLAKVVHVKPDYIIIGNGATELITIIQRQLVHKMGIPIPTFSEYIDKLQNSEKVELFQLSGKNNYQLGLGEYALWLNSENISSALIINPGNPTGQLFPISEMKSFLLKMKHLQLILVDESFIDFSQDDIPSLLPFIEDYPNLIVIRSMSKHCGVPGLRLGYCCTANNKFLSQIKTALPVWNINTLAEYFLSILKKASGAYELARKKVIADVKELYEQLNDISGMEVYPTGSNFLMIKLHCGLSACEMQMKLLEEHGVYVRDCSNKVGLDRYHIRVASQGRKKDKRLIAALKSVSSQTQTK